MDVQAATATATILSPAFTQNSGVQASPGGSRPPISGAVLQGPPPPPAPAAPPVITSNAGDSSDASNSAIGPTPGLATLPAGPADGSKKGSDNDRTLASGVAALYNVAQQNVAVSFQIEQNPNEIVTVCTDKQTGKVIVQFPSETMIALAKLFDKLDGSVVNKKV
jgi:hypothetical protein